jgi:SAM-dependent methyltransferase
MVDTLYWNDFYAGLVKSDELIQPSSFCHFVLEYFKDNHSIQHVLDAGCGNGRDSKCLSLIYYVDGVDNSGYVPDNCKNCVFYVNNFVKMDKCKYDLVYSRFTFHSITNNDHTHFLKTIRKGCYLCIETRSDKSKAEERYFTDNHYRNFTNIEYLKSILHEHDFKVLYILEDKNLAMYKTENPYCIRVICVKK